MGLSLIDWWNSTLQAVPRELKRRIAAVLIYTTWNLWKDYHFSALPSHVLTRIKEEMHLRSLACGGWTLPHRGF
jgi:chemotaxis methyl-accepting protein methylase